MSEAIVPRGERLWVSYYDAKGALNFILTSKAARDYYFLYRVEPDGSTKKLGRSRSPIELEEKFEVKKSRKTRGK